MVFPWNDLMLLPIVSLESVYDYGRRRWRRFLPIVILLDSVEKLLVWRSGSVYLLIYERICKRQPKDSGAAFRNCSAVAIMRLGCSL